MSFFIAPKALLNTREKRKYKQDTTMKKIFLALCGLLFAVQTAVAQHNMLIVNGNKTIDALSTSSVDYATFKFNENWFSISNDGIDGKTERTISASCSVALGSQVKSLSQSFTVGVCYSKENTLPTVNDQCKSFGSSFKSYSFTLSSLTTGTTYYYRVYLKFVSGAVVYGDVVSVKTLGTKPVDYSKTIDGHKFVDLGLPSGLLWAETNIGAALAADDGDYFAWGETKSKSKYSWGTYAYGDDDDLSKYNSTDGLVSLESSDDAATVNWGSSCRMPTESEFDELLNSSNCTWSWSTRIASDGSSISGYEVTSVSNGNTIFLPASGFRNGESLYNHGSVGIYWSSTRYSSNANYAYYLYFYSGYHSTYSYYRYYGRPVRPVAER